MQLKRFTSLAVLAGCFVWSSSLGGAKFIPIYETLTIKAPKNSPAHIAFEELVGQKNNSTEWADLEKRAVPVQLSAQRSLAPLYSQKIVLNEMVFKKNMEPVSVPNGNRQVAGQTTEAVDDHSWIESLPRQERLRLQQAQSRGEILGENWQGSTWSSMAKEVLEKSGALVSTSNKVNPKVYVAAIDNHGQTRTTIPQNQIDFPADSAADGSGISDPAVAKTSAAQGFVTDQNLGRRIVGPLEITGGLAITNEHHIEIRRNDEGILKELGKVDLQQGLYNIDVEETSGTIVARLVDKDGKTVGEGSFRLNKIVSTQGNLLQGPKLKIEPHPDYSGTVASFDNSKANDVAPAQTHVTFIKGTSEVAAKKDGLVAMDNVTKGSSTVLRAAAPKYLQTAQIIVSGQEFKAPLYSASMVAALQDIIAQQRTQSFEGDPTIIWGKASQDGKPLVGIKVVVESDPSLQAIYFNQFMLPDPQLKATGENGLYAFVEAEPGFQSLLATRGESILGYSNVVVEEGSVAQGDIESSMKIEPVPLRVYDAFSGENKPATILMQSLPEQIDIADASKTISLQHVNRLGLMKVTPEGADYVAAQYVYNDTDEYIHVPLVQWAWLSALKNYLKINEDPATGTVVGFVPDEDFEVYLAGYDNFPSQNIVYFDMQGRILQNHKGIAGGGFILFNVVEDAHEVVVVGSRTQKIYSRVLPVDVNSLSVLTFRE